MFRRVRRVPYLLGVLFYFAVYFTVAMVSQTIPNAVAVLAVVGPFVWMFFLAAPRLRDIGVTGWLSLMPFVAGFAQGFAKSAGWIDEQTAQLVMTIIGAASLVFILLLAVIPGSKGANRFGPAPGAVAQANPDVFS